jgi:putative endonuclease
MNGFWAKVRAILSGRGAEPPRTANARTGEAGETAAAEHLKRAGLKILARNWRNPADTREEIDLVCADGEVLVFVEVKTRKSGARVGGYQAVNKRKKEVLLRACGAYLSRLRPPARQYRFDIVVAVHGQSPQEAARGEAARLPTELRTVHDAMEVLHYANVPLFPDRSMHRHG